MTNLSKRSGRPGQPSADAALNFASALAMLGSVMPDRTTVPQLVVFLQAAFQDMKDSPATLTDLKTILGPKMGRSLHTTYQIFLDRDLIRNDRPPVRGLGWLTQEPDPSDHRRNYLRLTPRGKLVVSELTRMLEATGD